MEIKNYLIEKSNALNQMRKFFMTLQELKLFYFYLAHIDASNNNSICINFPVKELQKTFNNEIGYSNIEHLKKVTKRLLEKIIEVNYNNGGYTQFHLFRKCSVKKDKNNEWYIELIADEESIPLIFELQNAYFTYKLWNIINLKSANQIRLFEILKQFENSGWLVISVEELRLKLGIELNEYKLWYDFRKKVLDVCQKALAENTDIVFEYTIHKKAGRKITHLRFEIKKNQKFTEEITSKNTRKQQFLIKNKEQIEQLNEQNINNASVKKLNIKKKSITKEEIDNAKEHILWKYAYNIAKQKSNKDKINTSVERYAIGILKNWIQSDYKTVEDLINNAIIEKNSYFILDW